MKVKATEKRYYTIGEVAKRFNVKPSLIRFWETESSLFLFIILLSFSNKNLNGMASIGELAVLP